jgi:hypothetical protein
MRVGLLAVSALFSLAACGGALAAATSAEPKDAAADEASAPAPPSGSLGPIGLTEDAGQEDAGSGSAGPPTCQPPPLGLRGPFLDCPPVLPAGRTPCDSSAVCEYGPNAQGACTTLAECVLAGEDGPLWWRVVPPPSWCGTAGAGCPASFGETPTNGSFCRTTAPICDYAQGRCACEPCAGSSGDAGLGMWQCVKWPTGGDCCPDPRPLLGSACASEGQRCNYSLACRGLPDMGPAMVCTQGTWVRDTSGSGTGVSTCPAPPLTCEGPP